MAVGYTLGKCGKARPRDGKQLRKGSFAQQLRKGADTDELNLDGKLRSDLDTVLSVLKAMIQASETLTSLSICSNWLFLGRVGVEELAAAAVARTSINTLSVDDNQPLPVDQLKEDRVIDLSGGNVRLASAIAIGKCIKLNHSIQQLMQATPSNPNVTTQLWHAPS